MSRHALLGLSTLALLVSFSLVASGDPIITEVSFNATGPVQLDAGGEIIIVYATGTGRPVYDQVTGAFLGGGFEFGPVTGTLGGRSWSISGGGTLDSSYFGKGTGTINPDSLVLWVSDADILSGSGGGSGQFSFYRRDNVNPAAPPLLMTVFGSGSGRIEAQDKTTGAKQTITLSPATEPAYMGQVTWPLQWVIAELILDSSFGQGVQPVVDQAQGTMTASLTPTFGLTIEDAAELMGFDHFNWVNVVKETNVPGFPGGTSPFYDPPLGPPNDNLPWFYNEPGTYQNFSDAPRFQDQGSYAIYETHLVGIAGPDPLDFVVVGSESDMILDYPGVGFKWRYTQTTANSGTGTVDLFQNLDPTLGTPGEIEFLGAVVYDDEQRASLQDLGFTLVSSAVVPEPSTLALLSMGAVVLLTYGRRRRRRLTRIRIRI